MSTIKWVSESSKDFNSESTGFTFKDFVALYGKEYKTMEDGIYTLYNTSNVIYKQYNLYEIRDQFNNLLFEVRQDRGDNIDFTKNFSNITQ